MSAVNDDSTVHTATDQTADKKPRYSTGSIESSIHTTSVASAHSEVLTDDDSESSVRTESTLKSQSIQQSVKSNLQATEDEKGFLFSSIVSYLFNCFCLFGVCVCVRACVRVLNKWELLVRDYMNVCVEQIGN